MGLALAGDHMGLIGRVLNWALDVRGATPRSPPELDASSISALSAAIRRMQPQERGWVTLSAGQRLFSPMENQYAFGEMDDEGRVKIAAFANRAAANYSIMPVEGRIYFIRS
jgi:hypothetical protein